MLRYFASCLLWSETRSAVLHHVYFGVRHAPPVLHMNALFLLLLFCECSSLLVLRLALSFSLIFCSELVSFLVSSSLILMFIIYESYFIIWLVVEIEERKSFLRIVMQMEACVDCDIDFACHVDIVLIMNLLIMLIS